MRPGACIIETPPWGISSAMCEMLNKTIFEEEFNMKKLALVLAVAHGVEPGLDGSRRQQCPRPVYW